MQDIHGKVAVVTGAASGIGRGMCEAFIDAGMRVVLADVEEQALERTSRQLRAGGADVHSVRTDVSKPEQVQALADETLRHYGAVHVVCNNAGVATETIPSWGGTLDDWNWVLGVNLMGVIYGVRTFLPILINQGAGGHIVNTASLAGLVTGGNTPYAVTKFGVVALSEGIYLELKQGGYRPSISVLCPGFVNTNILNCARNRPPELAEAAEPMVGPVADAFREWLAERGLVAAEHMELAQPQPARGPVEEGQVDPQRFERRPPSHPVRPVGMDGQCLRLSALAAARGHQGRPQAACRQDVGTVEIDQADAVVELERGERQRQVPPPEHARNQDVATKARQLLHDGRDRQLGDVQAGVALRVVVPPVALELARHPERPAGRRDGRPAIIREAAMQRHA
jgi:NAD(P)-dependent dehydrogenase (short-subunit alcohol dehydrogenase family)